SFHQKMRIYLLKDAHLFGKRYRVVFIQPGFLFIHSTGISRFFRGDLWPEDKGLNPGVGRLAAGWKNMAADCSGIGSPKRVFV
ncbi:MAG: hypothetical protein JXA13_14375, partial [Anaerolineales bacterium]|nr:hypothetical protein [Anaerolineales bacterium]